MIGINNTIDRLTMFIILNSYGNEIGFNNYWTERLYILVEDEFYAVNEYLEKGTFFYMIIIHIIEQVLIIGKNPLVKKPNFLIISFFIINYSY